MPDMTEQERERLEAAERQLAGMQQAAHLALAHVLELRDAWDRKAIREHDRLGATRYKRNVDVEIALRSALAAAELGLIIDHEFVTDSYEGPGSCGTCGEAYERHGAPAPQEVEG